MDVCGYRIASGGARVVRHRIFTSSTPILQHQSSVSHRWDRVSYDRHNGSYIFGLFQRRHPEIARLSSHLERFAPELLLQESLVFFGELHDYNTVRHQEANELSIVKVAEASHHFSGSYSFPI